MKYTDENILFIGPVDDLGGIGSVLKVYREKFIKSNFISTYPINEKISKRRIFISALLKINKLLRDNKKIKIIHIHCASWGSFFRKSIVLVLGKFYGKQIIMHMHGGGFKEFYNTNEIIKPFIKYILSLSDKVLCLSNEWKIFYKDEMKLKNAVVIENSIEIKPKKNHLRIENNINLLFMGKICDEKGIFELIEYLRNNNSFRLGKIKLYICGNGDSKRLEELIVNLKLSKSIKYLGWVEGLKKEILINESDIYILPSHFEGVPISILEAMAHGKPIIATKVGGIPSLVKNGINGWLMEKSIFTPLENIFEEILENPKVLEEYGDNAYKIASSHKPSEMFEKLDLVYQECLNDKIIYDKRTSNRMLKNNFWGSSRFKLIDILRNTKIINTLNELRKQQYYEKNELDNITNERLNNLLKIAKESTDYYKKGIEYKEIKTLEKNEIKNNYKSFISKSYKNKLYQKATGGSTGSPLLYYTTAESISYLWAGILLSWEVAGYRIGEKVAFLAGTSIIKKDIKHEIFYRLMNVELYSTYTLNEDKIIEYIEKMRISKVRLIYGYATALAFAADIMNQYKIEPLEDLKSIVSTAEVLTEENRKKIEKAFKVPVFNQYGCNEGGVSAFECENGNMHLISTRCKYEVDDDGNLLSTDLTNKGFILMKYFTGDQIELSDNISCSCRRNFPIIKNIRGRSYDMIIDSKNNIIHAAFFNILFKNDSTIRQFQVQFDKDKISILIDTGNSKSKTKDYQHYIDSIKKHLSFTEYEILLNNDLLKSKSFKHRYVINKEL